jgi:O-antigen/teichoic acid export membrane protein
MNFGRNVQSTLVMQAVISVFALALQVLLARWLSEPDRGLYAVVVTFALLGEQVLQLGLRLALIYRIHRASVTPGLALGAALQITVAMLALGLGVALLFDGPLRERLLMGASPAFLWVAVALTALQVLGGLFEAAARAIDRFELRSRYQMLLSAVTLGAVALVLVGARGGPLAALLAIAAVRAALLAGLAVRVVDETGLDLRPHAAELRATFDFSLRGYLQQLLAKLHERIDVVLLAALSVDAAQIAFYAVAVSVIERLRLVSDSIGAALLPKLAALPPEETGAYAAQVTRHSVFWVCLAALGIALLAPPLMPLVFGPGYAASVVPLLVLAPAAVLLTVRRLVANYFTASGRPGFNAGVQAGAFALNVVANLALIPRLGIVGAALASLISYGFEALATLFVFRRETGQELGATLVARRGDLAPYLERARRYWPGLARRDS